MYICCKLYRMAKVEKQAKPKNPFAFEDITESLTDRQKLFCMYYVGECKFNGTKAAEMAGYEPNNAASYAVYLLKNPNISQYIESCKTDLGMRIGVDAEMIAREYMKLAFLDISDVVNEDGNLKQISDMGANAKAAISGIELNEMQVGEGSSVVIKKVRLYNKIDALERIAKMIGVDGEKKVKLTVDKGVDGFLLGS